MAGPKKYDSELFAALHTVVAACRGRLSAGEDIAGTLRVEGLDVEVSLRIRPVVSNVDRVKHSSAAMALLARDGFRDHCPCQVMNRSAWRIAKMKSCEGKVAVAVVRGIGGRFATAADVRFEFRCRAHADEAGPDLVAVVELPAAALKKLRAERQRARDERYARERSEEAAAEAAKAAK